MQGNFTFEAPLAVEYIRILPEIILTITGTAIMMVEAMAKSDKRSLYAVLTLVGLLAALGGCVAANGDPGTAFHDMVIIDGFATFFRALVIVIGILIVLTSTEYLRKENAGAGEYFALMLYSIVGQCVMATANELIMVFIGIEISSIATYVMAGYLRDDPRNNESALKYFLTGSFATAFLLYGIAWIYGITGSTQLTVIREALRHPAADNAMSLLVGLAAALMFVGFAFKVSGAPFQVWAPDVYQGAPAPVTAFMSAGPKAAAFAVFTRVFVSAFAPIQDRWEPVVWACALLTMIVGNFAALAQTNLKRLLAYSSIAHAGYVLVAITAHSSIGTEAVMFYMASYAVTNIGAFAVVTHLARKGERYTSIEDLAGLGVKQPVTAAMLTIFLMSLIGIPLTGGFFGKFYIFKAALDANLVWLAVLGLLNSAVAAYYYLRLLVVMYFTEPGESTNTLPPVSAALQTVIFVSAAGTLLLGIFPQVILDFATKSALR